MVGLDARLDIHFLRKNPSQPITSADTSAAQRRTDEYAKHDCNQASRTGPNDKIEDVAWLGEFIAVVFWSDAVLYINRWRMYSDESPRTPPRRLRQISKQFLSLLEKAASLN